MKSDKIYIHFPETRILKSSEIVKIPASNALCNVGQRAIPLLKVSSNDWLIGRMWQASIKLTRLKFVEIPKPEIQQVKP